MELENKIIVVTGAASGIGRALAERFVAHGARAVVAVDIDGDAARRAAEEADCIAMTANVALEEDIRRVIESTERDIGPIDLYCSNAGIARGADAHSPDDDWQASWDVNVMSHVYASRHLLPRMRERGNGYFLITASAAGLLNQIGSATYGTTKHAAVGFAEWLALTYQHDGIKVSVLCPQAVRTAMVSAEPDAEGSKAAAGDGMIEPEDVAVIVAEKLRDEAFLILPHPEVLEYMRRKTSDYDRWIGGMNRLYRRLTGTD